MAETNKKRLSTSQILTKIRGCDYFSEVEALFENVDEVPAVGELLYRMMDKKHIKPQELISQSGIERSYFYHILSGKKVPSRNILLRLCLCLQASLKDTNQLLKHGGQAVLYARNRRDALLIFAVNHSLGMAGTNELLLSHQELPLYREETKHAKR